MKLDGFGLFVTDMPTMVRFYRDVLGFAITEGEDAENVYLVKDGTLFMLYERKNFEQMTSRKYDYIKGLNGHFEIALSVDTFDDVDAAYAEQIGRYYTALSELWTAEQYFDNGLSELPAYYYEGEPLDNVGFAYQDLNNDGQSELIIGAILNAELDPVVFEIWTLVDGEPVMVAQSGSRNRYFLQFFEEENAWYVANEGSNNAANFGTYYLMLIDGKLEVTQGIVFDAAADEANPWFMAYDLDWDASNDEPIDEEMANAILDSNRVHYTVAEYIPYSLYK